MDRVLKEGKLKVSLHNIQSEQEHSNQDVELFYILQGTMNITADGKVSALQKEDLFLVNANKRRSFRASKDIFFAKLNIPFQLLSDVLQSVDILFWCNSAEDSSAGTSYDELRRAMNRLLKHYLGMEEDTRSFGYLSCCYQVIHILSVHFMVRKVDMEQWGSKDRQKHRISLIDNYIQTNYMNEIGLNDLSKKLYLTNAYLSRFFKKNYGVPFMEYLTEVRLYHAVEDLLYTDWPITKIIYENGFSGTAAFHKAFKKKYGEAPSVWRKRMSDEVVRQVKEDDAALNRQLREFLYGVPEISEEAEAKSEICAAYTLKPDAFTQTKRFTCINIGEAAELLRSEVQEHVLYLQSTLHLEYVRFWNITSRGMYFSSDGEYNFSRLDYILDFLLQAGLKPHIDLGGKRKLYVRRIGSLIDSNKAPEALGSEEWKSFIGSMMRHLARRYGSDELDTWRMELWFEESSWGNEKAEEEYFKAFTTLYRIVRSYSGKMEIGGCGLRGDLISYGGKEFLEKWCACGCQPDFLSVYLFAYQKEEFEEDTYSRRVTDNDGLLHMAQRCYDIIRSGSFSGKKVYLSEWNMTISDRNYISDSSFMGAFVVKNVLDMYDFFDDMIYYNGTDRVFDYFDSATMLYGGRGVVSKDGILKPSGFAFYFLSEMYPYVVGKGRNYLITTNGHGSFGILCHNQRALNYNYYLTDENNIEKDGMWKYFEDQDSVNFHMELMNAENGEYKIKTYRIDSRNGSVLDMWGSTGFETELSKNDIKYLRRICEPKLSIQKHMVENGKLELELLIPANQIVFIRIRKII